MNQTISPTHAKYPYPRKRPLRWAMRRLARLLLRLLAQLELTGLENVPKEGPVIVVANHFSILDVAAIVAAIDRPTEFLGGHHLVDAPPYVKWLPKLWGFYEVHRGSVSRDAMHASVAILNQGGFLAIYPEGGSWAQVLRPARPGTAFLVDKTDAILLPVGLSGFYEMFPTLLKGRRPKISIKIGKPFGPLHAAGKGKSRRVQLDKNGDTIMEAIAPLLPAHERGVYSDDPKLRAEAQLAAVYPYDKLHETGLAPHKKRKTAV